MFTGIVQDLVPVSYATIQEGVLRLGLALGPLAEGLVPGASVAVNGTCLTVTRSSNNLTEFDVIDETRRLTNLGDVRGGVLVNVERSFRVGDEVGGHIVSGHVSGTAEVSRIETGEGIRNIHFCADPALMKYISHKGFVALDGASLTVAAVDPAASMFTVCLIPETIQRTTLGRVSPGDRVNIEIDSQTRATVDTVERMLASPEWLAHIRSQM